jgi:DNA-binding transcriptional LysR family regulator
MDSLGSLNAFVHAANARSFTVAGRQLGVSSSAIGKAVARMEERLGVRLFHRSTRSITLTAEGALFLERCRRIFSEIEAAELELSQTHEAPRGTLRVSLPLVGMLMMPTLVGFMRAYPEIMLDLDFSDRVVDVIEEGFDAVIRFADVGDSRLMSRALGTYRRRLVAAPAYLAGRDVPLTPDDLRAHACLFHKFPTSRKFERWPLGPEHAGIEAELRWTAVASTLEPLICMAEDCARLVCRKNEQLSASRYGRALGHPTRMRIVLAKVSWGQLRRLPSPGTQRLLRDLTGDLCRSRRPRFAIAGCTGKP